MAKDQGVQRAKLKRTNRLTRPRTTESMLVSLIGYAKWKEVIGIVLIVIIGLVVRLEDIHDWKANPNIAMYKGEPLLTTFDGYYYLSLAKDIVEGTYTKIDHNRDVPKGVERRTPPPLLSVLGAYTSILTGASLNWVGVVLPAALGVLLVIPLYGLGRFYGGPVAASAAALVGILSSYYLFRSSAGWFDTDCMNVTWATSITYFFLKFAKEQSAKRYIYFVLGVCSSVLFILWWDSTPATATAISLIPFATALAFFYRPQSRKELLVFSMVLIIGSLGVLTWQGFDLPVRIVEHITGQYHYITTKQTVGTWPSIAATISEQRVPSFYEIIIKTTSNPVSFLVSILGLALLFLKKPKDSLFLSVPIALASLSFFAATRFLIFLAPVAALGIGFFAAEVWRLKKRHVVFPVLSAVMVLVFVLSLLQGSLKKTSWPKEPPSLVDGFVYAGTHTPRNAVLWAWWDHGYPVVYWARRGTVGDGSIHDGERSSYNGLPLATSNQRLAANFMCFYVARGIAGIHKFYAALHNDEARGQHLIKEILSAGPDGAKKILSSIGLPEDEWLRFFYPRTKRPVYLFLDQRLTNTSYWWFWLGSWDAEKRKGVHSLYQAFYDLKLEKGLVQGRGILVDIEKGLCIFTGRLLPLKRLVIVTGKESLPIIKTYNVKRGIVFEMFLPSRFGAVMDLDTADSVFNTLFLRHSYDPKYFEPIRLKSPLYQVWKVNGDSL